MLHYRVVDVFTNTRLEGNPLAVFSHADGLERQLMQSIARELNLSETVFIQRASEERFAARLRIFTPTREMKFAGHPTVGAAWVLLDEGFVQSDATSFVVEENVGPVPVRVERSESPMIWLTTPPIELGPRIERGLAAEALGLKASDLLPCVPQVLSAGNPNVFVALKDAGAVDGAAVDLAALRRLRGDYPEPVCIFVFAPTATGAYSRMFAPEHGVAEDPATGSATGPLAAYMLQEGLVSGAAEHRFVSEQGTKMGRRSLLHVRLVGERGSDAIEVGGQVTPLIRATMEL